ncbi:MAG: WD40 repeat domain-containing protein [Bacteroidota bacterium]
MRYFILSLLLLTSSTWLTAQCYERFMEAGKAAYEDLDFDRALKQFKAAEVCCEMDRVDDCDAFEWIEKAQTGYYDAIQERTLEILATDLANKSREARKKGFRTNAFRLVEYANELAPDNPKVHSAAFDAVYGNSLQLEGRAQTFSLLWSEMLKGHTDYVNDVDFSPDGSKLVTVSDDGTAKIWDATTFELMHNLEGHLDFIMTGNFSPDGKLVATASDDGSICIWDAASGKRIRKIVTGDVYVSSAVFSKDGQELLAVLDDTDVAIWTIDGLFKTYIQTVADIEFADYSPDGQLIITFDYDGVIRFWSADNGLFIRKINAGAVGGVLPFADRFFSSIDYSRDGMQLLIATHDKRILAFDLQTGAKRLSIAAKHAAAGQRARYLAADEQLLIIENDQFFKLYDIGADSVAQYYINPEKNLFDFDIVPSETHFVTVGESGTSSVWSLGKTPTDATLYDGFKGYTFISPARTTILQGGLYAYEPYLGSSLHEARGEMPFALVDRQGRRHVIVDTTTKAYEVYDFFFEDEQTYYFISTNSALYKCVAGDTMRVAHSAPFQPTVVHGVPGGAYMVLSDKSQLGLWHKKTGVWNNLEIPKEKEDQIVNLAMSPDESELIVCFYSGKVVAIQLEAGKKESITTRAGIFKNRVIQIAYTAPDSNELSYLVATDGSSGTIKLFDTKNEEIYLEIEAFGEDIINFDLSPDGQSILLITGNDHLQVWDIATKQLRIDVTSPLPDLRQAYFLDNEQRILLIGGSGKAIAQNLSSASIMGLGRAQAGTIATEELLRQDFEEILTIEEEIFTKAGTSEGTGWRTYGEFALQQATLESNSKNVIPWLKIVEKARDTIKNEALLNSLNNSVYRVGQGILQNLFWDGQYQAITEFELTPPNSDAAVSPKQFEALSQWVVTGTDEAANAIFESAVVSPNELGKIYAKLKRDGRFCNSKKRTANDGCIPKDRLALFGNLRFLPEDTSFMMKDLLADRAPATKQFYERLTPANVALHKCLERYDSLDDKEAISAEDYRSLTLLGELYQQEKKLVYLHSYLFFLEHVVTDYFTEEKELAAYLSEASSVQSIYQLLVNYYKYMPEKISFFNSEDLQFRAGLDEAVLNEYLARASIILACKYIKAQEYAQATEIIDNGLKKIGRPDEDEFIALEVVKAAILALTGNDRAAKVKLNKWALFSGNATIIIGYLEEIENVGITHPTLEAFREIEKDDEAFYTYLQPIMEDLYTSTGLYTSVVRKLKDERKSAKDSLEYIALTEQLVAACRKTLNSDINMEIDYEEALYDLWLRSTLANQQGASAVAIKDIGQLHGPEVRQLFEAFSLLYAGNETLAFDLLEALLKSNFYPENLDVPWVDTGILRELTDDLSVFLLHFIDGLKDQGLWNEAAANLSEVLKNWDASNTASGF